MKSLLILRAIMTFACLIVSVGLLSGCVTSAGDARIRADAIAQAAGMHKREISTGMFTLVTYSRITRPDEPVTIYIEGDGAAWVNRYQPSEDPTPRRATGLLLATADRSANVVYLARPCQFVGGKHDRQCDVAYWTSKRFAPEVVASMDEAVSAIARQVPGQALRLVGYSGGGAIAVLIAARRQDVQQLRTVAGNLDHEAVNRYHKVSPMPASRNAIDVAQQVRQIPQIHYSGSRDTVIPVSIGQVFAEKAGRCAQQVIIDGAGHEGGWSDKWPALLEIAPVCL